jgi:hypothetical protein
MEWAASQSSNVSPLAGNTTIAANPANLRKQDTPVPVQKLLFLNIFSLIKWFAYLAGNRATTAKLKETLPFTPSQATSHSDSKH